MDTLFVLQTGAASVASTGRIIDSLMSMRTITNPDCPSDLRGPVDHQSLFSVCLLFKVQILIKACTLHLEQQALITPKGEIVKTNGIHDVFTFWLTAVLFFLIRIT